MTTSTKELLQSAYERHGAGDHQGAEELYRLVLTQDPENLNGLQLLGLLMHERGRLSDAVAILQQAVAVLARLGNRNSQHAALYNNLGNALRAAGRGTEAAEQYRCGLALDPDLAEIHVNLGSELLAQGELVGAVACYERARALGALSAKYLCNLASAYAAMDMFGLAQDAYREAIGRLDQRPDTRLLDPSVADDKVARPSAAAISPTERPRKADHIDAFVALVRILIDKRHAAEAVDVCRSVATVTPDDAHAHYLHARTLCDLGEEQASIVAFQRCLKLDPTHVEALHDLALVLIKTGFGRLAIPVLEMAISVRPDDASCHVELGNLLQSFGEIDRAFACFRRANALRPLTTWSAERRPADFSVLLIESPGAGNTPPNFLFGHASFDRHFLSLLPDVMPDIDLLRAHGDIVVNLISDVDQGRQMLSVASDLIDRLDRPTINHPRKILATSREAIARLLSGIPHCRVPRTIRCTREVLVAPEGAADLRRRGLVFPLLLRLAGTHGGDAFEKVGEGELATFLARYSGDDFYVTEYADYQSRDGYFRKYRFMFTNGEILPYHLAIGDQWKVHHFRTDMGRHTWMQDEERAFLENPRTVFSEQHYSTLREIQAAVGLEFFGIDCSLDVEGRVVVFEVNASMLVHDDNKEFPYKTPYCARVKEALHAMLARSVAHTKKDLGRSTSEAGRTRVA